ncbi:hypothetical protein CR513_47604, partial [Mucuna pruriens]
MESKVEALEQQNQDLRGEVGQLWEQMAQMFQILTQTNAVATTLNGYARNIRNPLYGMPYGWNTENAANKEQEHQNIVNNGPVFNISSRAGPNPKEDLGAQHQTLGNPPPCMVHRQASQSKEKWQCLEERLRAIEGGDKYGLEVVDLCLVSDVGLPTDFKTTEFDKYKGTMYCRNMATYIYDDKVLIHYFQDSLTVVGLSWYVGLERGRIKTWRDLAEAFLKQY